MPESCRSTIALVGDVMFLRRLDSFPSAQGAGFQQALARLRESAVRVGNLEMPLSRRGSRQPKHANLRADPERATEVRALGFQGVTLANNHMMDYGAEALLDTLAACDAAGLRHCGAGSSLDAALDASWFEVGEQRVALLSVSSTLPPGSEATEAGPGIAPIGVLMSFECDPNLLSEQPGTVPVVRTSARPLDRERVCERVRELSREADCVIVAIHWGVPGFWLSPSLGVLAEYQQPLGRALIDAGADLILGHHAHALHGIERYRGKAICYSVGNFIFEDPRGFMEPEALIVEVRPRAGQAPELTLVPLLVDDAGLPRLATGAEADRVFDLLSLLSAPFTTPLERRGDEMYLG